LNQLLHLILWKSAKDRKTTEWLGKITKKLATLNDVKPEIMLCDGFLSEVSIADLHFAFDDREKFPEVYEKMVTEYLAGYIPVHAKKYESCHDFLEALDEVNAANKNSEKGKKGAKRKMYEMISPGLNTVGKKRCKNRPTTEYIAKTCRRSDNELCAFLNSIAKDQEITSIKLVYEKDKNLKILLNKIEEGETNEHSPLLETLLGKDKYEKISQVYSTTRFFVFNVSMNDVAIEK